MALEKNMSLARMKSFLNEELKEQILLEVAPILHLGQEQGGYFGVTRHILCFVDFLGALYSGYRVENLKEKEDVAMSKKAIKFIIEVMKEVDEYYELNGASFYEMYRHGLVHLYQPKIFFQKSKGKQLQWLVYKGPREKAIVKVGNLEVSDVRHVGIVPDPYKHDVEYLPVSINCLYYDLIQAIDIYIGMLENDKSLQGKFISAANVISGLETI